MDVIQKAEDKTNYKNIHSGNIKRTKWVHLKEFFIEI